MEKTIQIGRSAENGVVEITVSLTDGELSMVGAVWNRSHSDWQSGGQNYDTIKADCATLVIPESKLNRMLEVWRAWHLNHMRAGCAHQRATWDVTEKVTLTHYTWTTQYYDFRKKAENGKLTTDEYLQYVELVRRVDRATLGFNTPKYQTLEIGQLIDEGWIKIQRTEEKTVGWVTEQEHPLGLLSKPCRECGYRYGSSWLKEPLPSEILTEIESW